MVNLASFHIPYLTFTWVHLRYVPLQSIVHTFENVFLFHKFKNNATLPSCRSCMKHEYDLLQGARSSAHLRCVVLHGQPVDLLSNGRKTDIFQTVLKFLNIYTASFLISKLLRNGLASNIIVPYRKVIFIP